MNSNSCMLLKALGISVKQDLYGNKSSCMCILAGFVQQLLVLLGKQEQDLKTAIEEKNIHLRSRVSDRTQQCNKTR